MSYADLGNRIYVSPEEYDNLLLKLCSKIKISGYEPDSIVTIERAGFNPLRRLLDIFPAAEYDTLRVVHYKATGETLDEPKLLKDISKKEIISGKNVLIVDECTDTGKTAEFVLNHIKKYTPKEVRFAVLFHKYSSKYEPNYWVKRTDKWIYFYYETAEAWRELLRKGYSNQEIIEHFKRVGIKEEEISLLINLI